MRQRTRQVPKDCKFVGVGRGDPDVVECAPNEHSIDDADKSHDAKLIGGYQVQHVDRRCDRLEYKQRFDHQVTIRYDEQDCWTEEHAVLEVVALDPAASFPREGSHQELLSTNHHQPPDATPG